MHSVDCNANRRLRSDSGKGGYVLAEHCYHLFKYEVLGWVLHFNKI
jgi:hypothetical protein